MTKSNSTLASVRRVVLLVYWWSGGRRKKQYWPQINGPLLTPVELQQTGFSTTKDFVYHMQEAQRRPTLELQHQVAAAPLRCADN